METFLLNLLKTSLLGSLAILAMLVLKPLWRERYRAKTRCWLWLALAVFLLLPVDFSVKNAPVQAAPPKKAAGSRGNRAQQAAKKQLTICETAIARLEADIARLDGEMAQHACDAEKLNELYRQQQDVQKQLEQEMERWEELSLQAEEQEER